MQNVLNKYVRKKVFEHHLNKMPLIKRFMIIAKAI